MTTTRACQYGIMVTAVAGGCIGDEFDRVSPFADAAIPTDAGAAPVTEVACATAPADHQVRMDNLTFAPMHQPVSSGDVVEWLNDDSTAHTVTSGGPEDPRAGQVFDSGTISPGGRYCLRFEVPSVHTYFCELHPVEMQGATITVH